MKISDLDSYAELRSLLEQVDRHIDVLRDSAPEDLAVELAASHCSSLVECLRNDLDFIREIPAQL